MNFTFITTNEQLKEESKHWKNEIAVDLECENNLHRFGTYLALIQISNKTQNWIIDILKVTDFTPLTDFLENPQIKKIFHDVTFDLRIIHKQLNCRPKNIFDTQLAALMLGKEKIGLGSLLEDYFSIKKQKKFQRVDWTKRPLSKEMLAYAVGDTAYLLKLKDKLVEELKERLTWVEEESRNLEDSQLTLHEQEYIDVAGVKRMSPQERGRFKLLFTTRNELARKLDKPPFIIAGNKRLLELALNPNQEIKRVHPAFRRYKLKEILKNAPLDIYNRPQHKKMTPKQGQLAKKILELRNKIGEELKIKPHLLMSQDQIKDATINRDISSLRDWQKTILEKELNKLI